MLKLSREMIQAFVEGTLKTLSIQCGITASAQKPYIKGTQTEPAIVLTAIVGITSSQFIGTIHLSFTESAFLAVMEKMLGEKFTSISDDLSSGIAEMLNIIYGSAKTVLNRQGHDIKSAIPTVIRGQSIHTKAISAGPTLVLPFKTDYGDFFVEFTEQTPL